MAGKRMVHVNICRSKKLNTVSLGAEALWVRILTLVDDNGNYESDALVVFANAIKNKKGVTLKNVESWLEELQEIGLLSSYEADDCTYIHFVDFHEFQTLRADRAVKVDWPIHPQEMGDGFIETGKAESVRREMETTGKPLANLGGVNSTPLREVEVKDKVEDESFSNHREGNFRNFQEAFRDALGRATKPKPFPQNVEQYQTLCRRYSEKETLDAINSSVELHGKAKLYKDKYADKTFLFEEAEDLILAKRNGTLEPPSDEEPVEISRMAKAGRAPAVQM